MEWKHITDHDLERYYLGMVKDETELAALEEHILACGSCAERADEAQNYVDAMRGAALDFFDPYEDPPQKGDQAPLLHRQLRRSAQPRSTAMIARSRRPLVVVMSGAFRSACAGGG